MPHGRGTQRYAGGDARDARNSTALFRDETLPRIYPHITRRWHALDVGCGNGRITHCLVPYFNYVTGLDPFEKPHPSFCVPTALYTSSTFDHHFTNRLRNDVYDMILFWGSFYLFAHRASEVLGKSRTMLSDQGVVVIGDDFRRNTDRDIEPLHDGLVYSLAEARGDFREVDEFIQADYMRVTVLKL